ncbi:hypothetical protein QWI17_20040 [Gilvimarinus sp. SDUM040013]|uniref:Uncharacterized protein n=1 Tax=Gilvimarinus gilvus TaxID=3058038 RepID=A0ABU4S380_9GAMM|nr:hypothetical protein [Gilvimarinus sp. SDUM040013]MDO3388147.1 hypothetical protein [Gilvimarinus sp. SDUM040013]MDX6850278.1 hypothetical protein [Gilvimarinus sp. SDUM040013]
MKKIVNIFSIIGVFATVFSSYVSYLAYAEDASSVEGGFIHVIHWKYAQALSPTGYEVKSTSLSVIPNGYEFTLAKGASTLLTLESRVPFSLSHTKESSSLVMLDGKRNYMNVGEKDDVPNTNCYVWLYEVENNQSSFQLRCDNT